MAKCNTARSKQQPQRNFYAWTITPDFERKSGINSAVFFYPERADETRQLFSDIRSAKRIRDKWVARLLVEGPIWDCIALATDLAVNEKVKEFLQSRLGDDLDFLPVELVKKNGKPLRTDSKYYAIVFRNVVKAYIDFRTIDWELIHASQLGAMIICAIKDRCRNSKLIDREIAEAMIDAGFTGLGFENLTGKGVPGKRGTKPRVFPEEAQSENEEAQQPTLQLQQIVRQASSFPQGWEQLLASTKKFYPQFRIGRLRSLPIEDDLHVQQAWLKSLFQHAAPDHTILAFWFGMFERIRNDEGLVGPELYACGNNQFNHDRIYDFDWAGDPVWFPDGRYTESSILDKLYELSQTKKPSEAYYYYLTLGYAALLVSFCIRTLPKVTLKRLGRQTRPIAVGFDSGDAIYAGSVSAEGWIPEVICK